VIEMKCHSDISPVFKTVPIEFKVRGTRWPDCPEPGQEHFEPDIFPTCSYCGSLDVETVLQAFKTPGMKWGGTDWKYGWPHKFYIEIPCEPYRRIVGSSSGPGEKREFTWGESKTRWHKFYSEHLIDATPEQLDRWNKDVQPLTGIRFVIGSEGDLRYSAIRQGHQGDGVIQ
jgi:hypothetical protein